MSRSPDAFVNRDMLVWARTCLNMSREDAAARLKVAPSRVASWEAGDSRPTVKQMYSLARIYKQSFAAFYLDTPPPVFRPPIRDMRRHVGEKAPALSASILADAMLAIDRREIYLELLSEDGAQPIDFEIRVDFNEDPEVASHRIRDVLGVSLETQREWRSRRVAFNGWRTALEHSGVLVFQSSSIDVDQMRAYSLAMDPCPVIVLNRKDGSYAARTFSLMHELAHLALREGGVCDIWRNPAEGPEEDPVEVFCNHLAGAVLIPDSEVTSAAEQLPREPSAAEVRRMASRYGVSDEVFVRRLLTLDVVDRAYYRAKRAEYLERRAGRVKKGGFVPPPTDVVSLAGRTFTREVMGALSRGSITATDASDYLGARAKHFDAIADLTGVG